MASPVKIYTRRGDGGLTSFFGGERVPKDDLRVEAYGTVDELNSVLGRVTAASLSDESVRTRIETVQRDLLAIGAVLATPLETREGHRRPAVPEVPVSRVGEMEEWIDDVTRELAPLTNFLLPGGSPAAAELHVARTVCRRAERRVVTLAGRDRVDEGVVRYLNRLSDLLFVFARLENLRSGADDVIWRPEEEEAGNPGESLPAGEDG